MGVFMIIREECIIKNKLQLLLELIRVHERFATLAEKEYDDIYIAEEADEVLMCMGLELEHKPSESMRLKKYNQINIPPLTVLLNSFHYINLRIQINK